MKEGTKARLRMEHRNPSALRPHPRNTKIHTEADVAAIANSIRRFGFQDPIGILPDGTIVEGHGRRLAAIMLCLDSVPCLVLEGMTERQADLYRIGHNRLNLMTGFDFGMLRTVVEEVMGQGIEIADMSIMPDLAEDLLGDPFVIGDEAEDGDDTKPGSFEIVWDDPEQQKAWTKFVGQLRKTHGKGKVGEVIFKHLQGRGGEHADA